MVTEWNFVQLYYANLLPGNKLYYLKLRLLGEQREKDLPNVVCKISGVTSDSTIEWYGVVEAIRGAGRVGG